MDWLLAAHQVAPLQFEMGGLWNPVSVRDQMVRGQEIARRAEIATLIGASRPLIVVGAGAGGVAAALAANKAGLPVVVIERGVRPFDRQLRTPTRTIYPYLYDWPHDRHVDDALVAPAVLPWLEARADQAALSWIAALGGRRFIAYGSRVSPPPAGGPPVVVHGGMVDVHVSTPAGTGWLPGGMLLSSVGFGAEITSIPAASGTYHGWHYWEPDALGQHQLGEPNPPDVLIAGGGDGALQDAIRVLLEPLYEDLRRLLQTLPAIPESLRLAIANTDDTVTRSWLWASGGGDACPLLQLAHTQLEAEVDAWWRRDQRAIATALDPIWRDDVGQVQLAHSCDHFGRSFPLNRFLVLLLERAARERTQRELAAPGSSHATGPVARPAGRAAVLANGGASPRGRRRRSPSYMQRRAVSRSSRCWARSRDLRNPARCRASTIDIGGSRSAHPPRRRHASGLAPGELAGQQPAAVPAGSAAVDPPLTTRRCLMWGDSAESSPGTMATTGSKSPALACTRAAAMTIQGLPPIPRNRAPGSGSRICSCSGTADVAVYAAATPACAGAGCEGSPHVGASWRDSEQTPAISGSAVVMAAVRSPTGK